MLPRALRLLGLLATFSTRCLAQQNAAHIITLDGKPSAPGATEKITIVTLAPQLEIYRASAKTPAHGTILLAPGGGYEHLSIDKEGRNVAKMLNEAGWDTAVLLYHTAVGQETRTLALNDALQAFALLQTRGGELGVSTSRLGMMGFSAGGHLAARLAHTTAVSGKPPAFLVLMYPAYLEAKGRLLDDVAPINAPVFMYIGEQDKFFLPGAQLYDAACKQKVTRCEFTVIPGVGHGFGLAPDMPAAVHDWPDKLRAFLASLDNQP